MSVRIHIAATFMGMMAVLGGNAQAACSSPYVGPAEPNASYYFSSACFHTTSSQTLLTNKVCSANKTTRGFKWTKINWASAWSPLRFGHCLVKSDHYPKVIDVPGSIINVSGEPSQTTNVYVPDLGQGANDIYYKTIDGEAPAVEGGTEEPFHFEVSYVPKATRIEIHATLSAQNPVFYLVLPASINSPEALAGYINSDYLEKITPLIKFSSEVLVDSTGKNDLMLYAYYDEMNLHKRTVLVSPPGTTETSINLSVNTENSFAKDTKEMIVCIGSHGHIITCL
ncbi:MAG TPA: hypothetical protein VHT21_03035 [Stellaceae bacterium]|nr:hypothetical protein [Stellaceae bacterium]